ncbi:unnamed protein product [Pleuronectes platessa]|uniref:WD repeat-containing protein 19 n=1 Tax=Pleuronectes platessa TaxID=8262 RepID=A0A9N7YIJ9_PLEPL|nr:unnamed protein product [Pleuronectes platessa]
MKKVFTLADKAWAGSNLLYKWQKTVGNFIAVAGQDNSVKIFDRNGQKWTELNLPGRCVGMDWDKDGDILAVIAARSRSIFLWDARVNKSSKIKSGMKDQMSLILWSKTSPMFAVGTNLLALGSEDNTLSISNHKGDTITRTTLCGEPNEINFSVMKTDERSSPAESTVSVSVGKKILMLFNVNDPENGVELTFQRRYGNIVSYHWYGDGNILVGFSNGYTVNISTHLREIGKELYPAHNHRDSLNSVAISSSFNKAASCGDNKIMIHDLSEIKDNTHVVRFDDETKGLDHLSWTDDGQLLAISTQKGTLHGFLTMLPILGDSFGTRLAYLTSPLEVTVSNQVEGETPVAIEVDIEPTFIAVGPYHVAVGMNKRAWFYALVENGFKKLKDFKCLGTIASMCLNSNYAAALFEGKVQLHLIEGHEVKKQMKLFPDDDRNGQILCHALTADYLYYGTDSGNVVCVLVEDLRTVSSYSHSVGVRKVFPDPAGTRLVIIDEKNNGFLLSPKNTKDPCIELPNFSPTITGVLWDNWHADRGEFVAYDKDKVYTYALHETTIYGPRVVLVGSTTLLFSQKPLLLYNGALTCQTASGKTSEVALSTHSFLRHSPNTSTDLPPEFSKQLTQALMLKRFHEAWDLCKSAGSDADWAELGKTCLLHMDVDLAIQVYHNSGNMDMVLSLQAIQGTVDMNLLAGHLAKVLEDYNQAQNLYLSSNCPVAALEMRRDLLHWESALMLAERLAKDQIPFVSKEYAAHFELIGDYVNALAHYKRGMTRQ